MIKKEVKKRLMSFVWRAGAMCVAVVLDMLAKEMTSVSMPAELTVVLGLVLGEVSKAIRKGFVK